MFVSVCVCVCMCVCVCVCAVVREAVAGFSLETVLSSIHLYRCHDYLELLATINILPDFIQLHPKVHLSLSPHQ